MKQLEIDEIFKYITKSIMNGRTNTKKAADAFFVLVYVAFHDEIKLTAPFGLLEPDVSIGPDGNIMFFWDLYNEHVELNYEHDDLVYMFYRNRKTGELLDAKNNFKEKWSDDFHLIVSKVIA